MLADYRQLRLGTNVLRTPLLVPSFSSKGFPTVKELIRFSSEYITDVALMSLYDYHYSYFVKRDFSFSEWLILDSGGYEASKDTELSELSYLQHEPLDWSEDRYLATIKKWRAFDRPTMVVTYDHPKQRLPYLEQVARADRLLPKSTNYLRTVLIKPETDAQTQVQIATIADNPVPLKEFDVIGVTEKELGNSLLQRLKNVAALRRALTAENIAIPIHIFGSLDTISTPLYFLAGADIFDGLTWLRFAFFNGTTIYKNNFGALHLSMSTTDRQLMPHVVAHNLIEMQRLQSEMQRYLNQREFTVFKNHDKLFKDTLDHLRTFFKGEVL